LINLKDYDNVQIVTSNQCQLDLPTNLIDLSLNLKMCWNDGNTYRLSVNIIVIVKLQIGRNSLMRFRTVWSFANYVCWNSLKWQV